MDKSQIRRNQSRKSRVFRVRKKVRGTSDKPRLSVSKTNAHLYVQLIDDEKSLTLAGFGTLSKKQGKGALARKSKESARKIGQDIAAAAKKLQIERVVFDRGRHKFHGIVAELANSAREAGLQF
jgi:large subunit ribosomal protein L18